MKKSGISVIIIILIVLLVLGGMVISPYNTMVKKNEEVKTALSTIDVQLKRRSDLIPNLVQTVKGYAAHEQAAIQAVADARAKLAGTSGNEKVKAENELSSALSRLLVVVENYPNLKADKQFTALTDELAGTENRIAVARKDYNDVAKDYNTYIKRFPNLIAAKIFGYQAAEYFKAPESDTNPPKVEF